MRAPRVSYGEWKKRLQYASLPALVVDLDAFDRNAKKIILKLEASGSRATIRLATKSIRCVELMKRAMAMSPRFQGWMTYRALETERLAMQGFDDFLLAYPEVEEKELRRLVRLHASGKTVRMVVDSEEILQALSRICREEKITSPFPVVVEIDVSLRLFLGLVRFGAQRSPLASVEAAIAFAKNTSATPSLAFHGFLAYESQIAGVQDAGAYRRFLNPLKRLIRRLSVPRVAAMRARLLREARAQGLEPVLLNGGGSGSLEWTGAESAVTEVSAGSALLCSSLFSSYSNQQGEDAFEPALFLALRCVRKPSPRIATCFGGGVIASGEPGWDKIPSPWLPEGIKLDPMEGCGEVQTPVHLLSAEELRIGDPLLLRPAKAGESLSGFPHVFLFEGSGAFRKASVERDSGV